MKLKDKMLIWPSNLDSSKSRLEGRKVPKGQGVQAPRIEELVEATRRLSVESEVNRQKSRPRTWWEKTGYIIVPKAKSRTEILRLVTSELRKIRSARTDEKGRRQ